MVQDADDREPNGGPHPATRDSPGFGHGARGDDLSGLLGIGRSIRPGIAVPATVLVVDMGGGALYLAGWREGPSAYLTPEDAVPLRRELARAFGSEGGVG